MISVQTNSVQIVAQTVEAPIVLQETQVTLDVQTDEVALSIDGGLLVQTGGGSTTLEVSWAYGDVFPKLVGTIPAGTRVEEARLYVDTACNAGVSLTLGSMAAHGQLLTVGQAYAQTTGAYAAEPDLKPVADYNVHIHVETGSLSQGAGRAVVYLA